MGEETNQEIGTVLAEAMGVETQPPADGADMDSFFEAVKAASTEETPEATPAPEAEAPKWAHEPTGKEFDSEVELLRYNSGYDANRMGTENAELRERLANLEGKAEAASIAKAPDRMAMKQNIWQQRSKEMLEAEGADFVLEGLESAANLMTIDVDAKIAALREEFSAARTNYETETERARLGVDSKIEQSILEKHPAMKAMKPAERMALVKELSLGRGTPKGDTAPAPKAALPQLTAADHVEGSTLSNPMSTQEALEAEFDKINDSKKELAILGKLVAQSQEFAGYTPG